MRVRVGHVVVEAGRSSDRNGIAPFRRDELLATTGRGQGTGGRGQDPLRQRCRSTFHGASDAPCLPPPAPFVLDVPELRGCGGVA